MSSVVSSLITRLQVDDTGVPSALNRTEQRMGGVEKAARGAAGATDSLSTSLSKAAAGGRTFATASQGLEGSMLSVGAALLGPAGIVTGVGILSVALGAAGKAGLSMAGQLETAFRRVENATVGGTSGIADVQQKVRRLSEETGVSQVTLATALGAAAKNAESSAGAFDRLEAALKLSKAEGTDLVSTVNSLDQVLDVFGASSTDAAKAAATLFVAGRGKGGSTELFELLKASAPALLNFKIDLDTAARALAELADRTGTSGRKLAPIFKTLVEGGEAGRQKILDLAAAIPPATDNLALLDAAFTRVNGSSENAAAKLREKFNNALIDLGQRLLPPATAALELLSAAFDKIAGIPAASETKRALDGLLASIDALNADLTGNTEHSESARAQMLLLAQQWERGRLALDKLGKADIDKIEKAIDVFGKAQYFSPAQLQQLQQFYSALAGARLQLDAKPSKPLQSGGSGVTVVDPASVERQQKALADLTRGFDELFIRASDGTITLEEFDKSFRALAFSFDQTKDKTAALDGAFVGFVARAVDARDALAALTAQKATAEFLKLREALLPAALKNFQNSVEALRIEMEKKGVTGGMADQIVALTASAHDAEQDLARLEDHLATIADSGLRPLEQLNLINAERLAIEAKILLLESQHPTDQTAELQRQAEVLELRKQLLAVEKATGAVVAQHAPQLAAAKVEGDQLADSLANVAQSAFGIATAILGADNAITHAIGGAAQLAQSFRDIVKLATDAETGVTSISKLFSTGAGLASALPAIGGIIGGVGAILSAFTSSKKPEDPLVKEQIENLKKNNQALADLRDGILKLTVSSSGSSVSAVRNVPLQATTLQPTPFGNLPRTDFRPVSEILADLRKAGVGLEDLRKVAQDFGITLSQSPTIQELQKLQEAINAFSLAKLLDTLEGQLHQLDILAQIDPANFGGLAGILKQIAIFAGPKGVPAIADALKGLDLSTTAGRAAAIAALGDLVKNIGTIDFNALGGLNPDDFLAAVAKLIAGLKDVPDAVTTAADAFGVAVEAYGVAVDQGSLSAIARLERLKAKFAELFPSLFAGIDFSNAQAFKASIQAIIDGFAADGVLTEAEKAQITALTALANAFGAAQAATDSMVDAVQALSEKFHLFGTDAIGRFNDLLDEFTRRFPQFAHLFDGLDVNTEDGRTAIQERIRALFAQLAEGGITASEQAVIDFLTQLFDTVVSATDQAVRDAQAAADAAAARRNDIFANVEAFIQINHITDPIEILRLKLKALADAFPALTNQLAQFDVATQAGRDALRAFLKLMLADNPALLGPLAAALGISVQQLRDFLLGLDVALNNTAAAVQTLADKLQAAFDDANFEIALNGITDPLQQLIIKAKAAAKVLPQVAAALAGLDLNTASGRSQAQANLIALGNTTTDPAVRQAILDLLNGIRSVIDPALAGGGAANPPVDGPVAQTLQGTPSITAVQADRWLDLSRTQLTVLREIKSILASWAGLTPTTPPNIPASLGGAGGASTITITSRPTINLNVGTGAEPGIAKRISDAVLREIDEGLARLKSANALSRGVTAR